MSAGEKLDHVRVFSNMMGMAAISLPRAWAQAHQACTLVFNRTDDRMGWHARLIADDDGAVLMSFPWHDHIDKELARPGSSELPVELPEDGWDDLEQGWWANVIPHGADVYLAQGDFGALADIEPPATVSCEREGEVLVSGTELSWHRVPRPAYDAAWQAARASCRNGDPSPVRAQES